MVMKSDVYFRSQECSHLFLSYTLIPGPSGAPEKLLSFVIVRQIASIFCSVPVELLFIYPKQFLSFQSRGTSLMEMSICNFQAPITIHLTPDQHANNLVARS